MQIYYELSDWFGQSIRQSGGALEGKQRGVANFWRSRARARHAFFRTMHGEIPGTSHTLDGSATVCYSYLD